jgi:hypothetical protein
MIKVCSSSEDYASTYIGQTGHAPFLLLNFETKGWENAGVVAKLSYAIFASSIPVQSLLSQMLIEIFNVQLVGMAIGGNHISDTQCIDTQRKRNNGGSIHGLLETIGYALCNTLGLPWLRHAR